MLTLQVRGVEGVVAGLEKIPPALHANMLKAMERVVDRLRQFIREDELSGQVLRARRGKLWFALRENVVEGTTSDHTGDIVGTVRVGGKVRRWAGVHEYGTAVHVAAYRRRSGAVRAYSYVPRRRAFLGPALATESPWITAEMSKAVHEAVARG